jgi:GNAT superfamily N-acetyltransferase
MKWIADHKLDKLNEKIDVFTSDTILGTPALALALRASAELLDNKMALGFPIKLKHKVIWVQVGTKAIGGLCYKFGKFDEARIILSFTDPEYRGLGIHMICKKHFEDICKNSGITTIYTDVHIDNTVALENNKKAGMIPKLVVMAKKIKKN